MAYVVLGLLVLVSLLVCSGLLLIWLTLLLAEGLPLVTKDLADLTCGMLELANLKGGVLGRSIPKLMPGFSSLTLSRFSLAKNMYAERPRLGALGSASC